jgi:mono/diheme cytochrome c family protein
MIGLASRFSTRNRSMKPFAPLRFLLILIAVATTWVPSLPANAELTAAQKKAVAEIAQQLRDAESLYQAGNYAESGKKLDAMVEAIDKFIDKGGPEAFDAVTKAFPRIVNAHALLELEGVTLKPFIQPERPDAAKSAEMKAESKPKPAAEPRPTTRTRRPMPEPEAPAGPSFATQVAPILVQRCGSCHINNSRGDFNMATFAMLAKGPPAGTVVFPGDVVASRLIESIETGDMPRGGGKVSPAELQLLKDWVLAGAKYDAPSPMIPLAALAANAPAGAAPVPMAAEPPKDPALRAATGSETVSFAKDIAPILLANCNGCHIDAMQVRGGLRMDTFAALMRGGDSGEIVLPTRAAASLLVKKIKGEEGDRMPAGGRPPLSEEQITLISKWIDENATLDAPDKDQPLAVWRRRLGRMLQLPSN